MSIILIDEKSLDLEETVISLAEYHIRYNEPRNDDWAPSGWDMINKIHITPYSELVDIEEIKDSFRLFFITAMYSDVTMPIRYDDGSFGYVTVRQPTDGKYTHIYYRYT